uniref:Uncharacterized protein n=1 Tax=Arundo donax TaxID=35708 RepID=A0A0A9F8M6_ARUDO
MAAAHISRSTAAAQAGGAPAASRARGEARGVAGMARKAHRGAFWLGVVVVGGEGGWRRELVGGLGCDSRKSSKSSDARPPMRKRREGAEVQVAVGSCARERKGGGGAVVVEPSSLLALMAVGLLDVGLAVVEELGVRRRRRVEVLPVPHQRGGRWGGGCGCWESGVGGRSEDDAMVEGTGVGSARRRRGGRGQCGGRRRARGGPA